MLLIPLSLLLLSAPPKKPAEDAWLSEAMPLQLAVRSPEDLAFKAAAEAAAEAQAKMWFSKARQRSLVHRLVEAWRVIFNG